MKLRQTMTRGDLLRSQGVTLASFSGLQIFRSMSDRLFLPYPPIGHSILLSLYFLFVRPLSLIIQPPCSSVYVSRFPCVDVHKTVPGIPWILFLQCLDFACML